MSPFDQKKQNVDTQINVAGNLNYDQRDAIIRIIAKGPGRYFVLKYYWDWNPQKVGETEAWERHLENVLWLVWKPILYFSNRYYLVQEHDFKVIVADTEHQNWIEEEFNLGEIIKINLKPGQYTVTVETIIDSQRAYQWAREISSPLKLSLTVGEKVDINLDYIRMKLKLSL
jgi:hypothetical protein